MTSWLYLLLLAVPGAALAEILHASPLVIFTLAALGLIPLAGLIGQSTEVLAARLGHGIGGLLNATFGNAAEIIIGLAALSKGLPEVVRASLAGSIIGNALLVLGMSMLFGGWKHRSQMFNPRLAGQYATMLALAVIGMAVPSLLATIGESSRPGAEVVKGNQLPLLSIGVSIVLLLCYAAYIAYSVFGLRASPNDLIAIPGEDENDEHNSQELRAVPSGHLSRLASVKKSSLSKKHLVVAENGGLINSFKRRWHATVVLPLVVLAAVTAITAFESEILVGTIEPLTKQVGLNPFFVGLIIIPLVGNAAEHFSAVTSAMRNHMEISLAITAGSSIQIALLAAPILVLAGPLVGSALDLNFSLLEVAMFALTAVLYAFISLDGESNWLEGLLLCAFYLILAVGTFFPPG